MRIHKITLFLMLACLASCTKDDPGDGYIQDPTDLLPPSEEIHQTDFTATLAARSEGKSWPLNAQLSLQYQKADGGFELALATIESVESDGSAKISAILLDAKDGGTLKLVYPASLANSSGDDIDTDRLSEQLGTLEDISERFDAATGSVTLQTKAGESGAPLMLEDRVSISKFTPAVDGTPIEGILSLRVSDGTHCYTAAPAEGCFGTDGIYLAMLPVSGMALNCTATTATKTYVFLSDKLTLQVGVLYDELSIVLHNPVGIPGTTPVIPPEDPATPPAPETPPADSGTPPTSDTPPTTTPATPPAPETPPVTTLQFRSTLASNGQPQTKAVDSDGKKNWVAGEKLNLYYEKTNGSFVATTATVDEVSTTDGSATFTATLEDPQAGGSVKFVYPATLAGATGDLDPSRLAAQHGTITDISAHFDAATGTSTLIIDGETCTTARVSMTNRVLIGKYTPMYDNAAIGGITSLTISDGTHIYTVTPSSGTFGTDGIYVAMLPVDSVQISIVAITGTGATSQSYCYKSSKPITLSAGKLYTNLAVPMVAGEVSRAGYGGYNID